VCAFGPGTRRSSDSLARGLPRVLSTLLVLGLLVGTSAAFAVTERLKLVPSPIVAPKVTEAFSPVCDCATDVAHVRFRLRDPDRLTVTIVDADGEAVGTVADGQEHPAGPVEFTWDGSGAAEGEYRAKVHLARARRTIVIPNTMRLDTTPPVVEVEAIRPRVFSPDGDGRADAVHALYSVSERASVLLLVDGKRALESPPRMKGKLDWYGRDRREGTYEVTLGARDLAGNEARQTPSSPVRLRFVDVSPSRVIVPAGVRFGVRVATDVRRYRWQLGGRRGSSSARVLVLRAPLLPGRYTLAVVYDGHSSAIPVFVRPRP
jgi:FlgD Ig-like domain